MSVACQECTAPVADDARWCGTCGAPIVHLRDDRSTDEGAEQTFDEAFPSPLASAAKASAARRAVLIALAVALLGVAAGFVVGTSGEQASDQRLPAGAELWRTDLPVADESFLVGGVITAVFDDVVLWQRAGMTIAIDRETGVELWSDTESGLAHGDQVLSRDGDAWTLRNRRSGEVESRLLTNGEPHVVGVRARTDTALPLWFGTLEPDGNYALHRIDSESGDTVGVPVLIPPVEGLETSNLALVSDWEGWRLYEQYAFSVESDPGLVRVLWAVGPGSAEPTRLFTQSSEMGLSRGQAVAVGGSRALVAGEDGVTLFDLATAREIEVFRDPAWFDIVPVGGVVALEHVKGGLEVIDRDTLGVLWGRDLPASRIVGLDVLVRSGFGRADQHVVLDPTTGDELGVIEAWGGDGGRADRRGLLAVEDGALVSAALDGSGWTWGAQDEHPRPVQLLSLSDTVVALTDSLLFLMDSADGSTEHVRPVGRDTTMTPAGDRFVLADGRWLRLVGRDGVDVWSERLADEILDVAVIFDVVQVRTAEGWRGLDLASGGSVGTVPAVAVVTHLEVDGRDLRMGQTTVTLDAPIVGATLLPDGALVSFGAFVARLGPEGQELWRILYEEAPTSAPVQIGESVVVVVGERTVVRRTLGRG